MAEPRPAGSTRRHVKSADRVLRILEAIAEDGDAQTLSHLSEALDIPRSSLHGIVHTMKDRGWLETDEHGRFRLGVRALLVGTSYVDEDDVVALSADTLDWLAAESNETVHLGRLDGPDIVYLAKRESPHPLRLFSAIGRRLPAFTTALGKSLLATRPEDDIERWLPPTLEPLTANTLTELDDLLEDLRRTRERGYARDNQENMDGLVCLAVALPLGDPPLDAISCSVPVARLGPERESEILRLLEEASRRVRDRVGTPAATR